MKKLIMLLAIFLVGGIGWTVGARFGLVTAWLLSSIGSLVGVYVGWRINRAYLD